MKWLRDPKRRMDALTLALWLAVFVGAVVALMMVDSLPDAEALR